MDIPEVRQLFPVTGNYNFQNTAAVAPISTRVVEAVNTYLARARDQAYLDSGFYRHADGVRELAARLINADPEEVTFIKSTSEGLCFVANGLNWSTGDNIVTAACEFPSNVYPWMALQARGVQIKSIIEEDGRIPLERLATAIDGRTRLVAVSAVQYASGFRTDLTALGRICQERGVFFCVDAIQALGVTPVDVKRMNIDFLSADGHKWICGPEGAGIFYVRRELQGHLTPTTIGWNSMKNAWDFDNILFEYRDDAKRFDAGAYNLAGIFGLGAAIELLLEVGLEKIHKYVMRLTDRLVEGVRSKGYRVVSPRQPGEGSGIVAFISDSHDLAQLQAHLQAEYRIVTAVRKGRLRCSPHLFNTEDEIEQVIDVLPKH
jgi:selenocysteine lyase/cysteine desulfurase